MTAVNVAYLATSTTGGWVSFTAHLLHGLAAAGCQPRLWKLSRRSEDTSRPYGMGFRYRNATAARLEYLARLPGEPMIVAASWAPNAGDLGCLLDAGAVAVIHDPTEISGAKRATAAALARARPGRVVVVRQTMLAYLPRARYLPHPYRRCPGPPPAARPWHAAAFSRIDWDKHTDLICHANTLLPPQRRVRIHGTLNRMYAHHRLDGAWPGWRAQYDGPMPRTDLHAGARVAARARWAVDMSVIKGDGGGTQYTFLEALDGGARLVIAKGWLTGQPGHDAIAPYALTAGSGEELAGLLAGDPPPAPDPGPLLAAHDPAAFAGRLLDTVT